MNAIVCVDRKWNIGYKNSLLFHLKDDMNFFKKTTTGKIVVMGRKTFESIGNKPLPNRRNIILTSDYENMQKKYWELYPDRISDMAFCTAESFDEVFLNGKERNSDDVFIIGGASIYNRYIKAIDIYYITQVDTTARFADARIMRPEGQFDVTTLQFGHDAGLDYKISKWVRTK